MQIPLQIRYHHCEPADWLSALVRDKAEELERFYPRLIGCQVTLERPGSHHRQGKGAHYRVRIELSVPGEHVVVSRDPDPHQANEDALLAVNEAFHAARRQLQDYQRRQRGDTKVHAGPPHARVTHLDRERGFGFLQDADGRSIYFHQASVLQGGFEGLSLGDEVRFAEESGEQGPQASSVEPVGGEGHHDLPPSP